MNKILLKMRYYIDFLFRKLNHGKSVNKIIFHILEG